MAVTTVTGDVARARLPRAERRVQITRAAASAFLAGGFDGTSMEQVADAAGVTRLIVYRIFESKEALYRAVLVSVTDRLRAEFEPHGAGLVIPAPDGIPGVLLGVARAHPDAFRLLWRHARHEPPFAAEAEAFRLITAAYADQIITTRATIADPAFRRWCATAVVDHLYEGICTWLDDGDIADDARFAAHLQAGLRAMVSAWSTSGALR